jgi:hypothetical protein
MAMLSFTADREMRTPLWNHHPHKPIVSGQGSLIPGKKEGIPDPAAIPQRSKIGR